MEFQRIEACTWIVTTSVLIPKPRGFPRSPSARRIGGVAGLVNNTPRLGSGLIVLVQERPEEERDDQHEQHRKDGIRQEMPP